MMNAADPNGGASLLHIVLAFAIVFGLLGAFGFGLRYVTSRGMKMPNLSGKARRLQIVETLPLDVRRRLMIVRWDDREHLILLGGADHAVVVASPDAAVKPSNAMDAG